MRLIDADALIAWLKKAGRYLKGLENQKESTLLIGKIIDHVAKMPTIDPESLRPQGEWIKVGTYRDEDGCLCYEYGCSLCNRIVDELEPYCPNCGKKMA